MTLATTAPTAAAEAPPAQRPMFATVTAKRLLTSRLARITLAGDRVPAFDYHGPDHLVRLFLPVGPDEEFALPVTADWWAELRAMPEEVRPVMRNYTVRRIDHARGELDIDFVLHGDSGPASAWACAAAPGDRVGLLSDGADYAPKPDTDWQLVIGDETAVPAVAAILETQPAQVTALLEVAEDEDELELASPASWLHRADGAARGEVVLETLRAMTFPAGTPYVWVAGESTLATSVRRYLVNERGIAKDRIFFCGYWRVGPRAEQ